MFILFVMSSNTITLSCTIPSELGEKLNLIATMEERNKSYYVKKALEYFLADRLEDAYLLQLGEEAYNDYLASGKEVVSYEEIRKDLKLDQ